MNKSQLLKLASFLSGLEDDQFDLRYVRKTNDCGTVACAVGWCPEVFSDQVKISAWGVINFPVGRGFRGARNFFELSTEETHFLFTPASYANDITRVPACNEPNPTIQEVVGRIRRLVNDELTRDDESRLSFMRNNPDSLMFSASANW